MPRVASAVLCAILGVIYLAIAWPGAGERGVIAEEATPYLQRYPLVLASADESGVRPFPPHDEVRGEGWVSTGQWPNVAYETSERSWPLLIRGYQSALGTYVGIAAGPLLGEGIAGIRRSSVLLGLVLLGLVFALARRLAPAQGSFITGSRPEVTTGSRPEVTTGSRPEVASSLWFAGVVTLACLLSPGLLFFSRTGYAFELASRLGMLLVLVLAVTRLSAWRALAVGLVLAAALVSRATIAATVLPALLLLLVHPERRAEAWKGALALGLGLGLAVLVFAGVQLAIPLLAGTSALASLRFAALGERTLAVPEHLVAQLTWVADPGVVLRPLLTNVPAAPALPMAIGTCVFLIALVRWWRGRASDGECLFVAAALGNALFGAWLYGHPQQFQLGMALEPLFALALFGQLAGLTSRRLALGLSALVLALRALQCGALVEAERVVDNPMLSGAAQRALVAEVAELAPAREELVTTTYNHVGVIETWSSGQHGGVHAYHVLRRSGDLVAAWRAILRAYPVRVVVLSVGSNAFEGPFTDNEAVEAALRRAAELEGRALLGRREYACESGALCLALQQLGPVR